jgi:hypothetical protein
MRSKVNRISRLGYAFLLTAALLIPGISSAAIVTGSSSLNTVLGNITVEVTISDLVTEISITSPDNRWVGINFVPPVIHTDNSYAIIASADGSDVFEANSSSESAPIRQTSQDLFDITFEDLAGDLQKVTMSRASDTGDLNDYLFEPIPQSIDMNWALGRVGASTDQRHQDSGRMPPLVLTAIPVPAAVWLFGSGLLGLIGVARRRKA